MQKKKKTAGRKPTPKADHRIHKVDVRLSAAELNQLDESRGSTPRARYLREICLRGGRQVGSGIDLNVMAALARVGNNINQIAKHVNTDGTLEDHMLLERLNELSDVVKEIKT